MNKIEEIILIKNNSLWYFYVKLNVCIFICSIFSQYVVLKLNDKIQNFMFKGLRYLINNFDTKNFKHLM